MTEVRSQRSENQIVGPDKVQAAFFFDVRFGGE